MNRDGTYPVSGASVSESYETRPSFAEEQGLRGGVLLPTVAPDVTWVKPLYHPDYDRLWAALQDLDLPVNLHSGTGSPNYGRFPCVPAIMITEVGFYGSRAFVHMLLSGVFARFPAIKLHNQF